MRVGTYIITGSPFTITQSMGIYNASILAQGGSIGITGSALLDGITSQEVLLPDGQSFTPTAQVTSPIEYLLIDPKGFTAVLTTNNL